MSDTKKLSNTPYEESSVVSANKAVPFAVVEAYKAIRTNLMFLLSNNGKGRVFGVSSPLPGEGKSSCSINLAIAFSQLGNRVLLIDADLRKPSIYRKLHLQNSKGLSSVLVGFYDFSESVISVGSNFDVLVSGPTPPNPSELLGSDAMSALLNSLKEQYDYIVIDTPPVNVVSDAVVLAPKTEGIVMVVQDHCTTHEQFEKAVASLSFAKARLLGVVLNSSADYATKYAYKSKRYLYK